MKDVAKNEALSLNGVTATLNNDGSIVCSMEGKQDIRFDGDSELLHGDTEPLATSTLCEGVAQAIYTAGIEDQMECDSDHGRLVRAVVTQVARRFRLTNPEGSFDKGGRWFPSDRELCECCSGIRQPSRAWPYSLMTHCRSDRHVANLYGVDVRDLRRMVRSAAQLKDRAQVEQKALAA